MNKKLICTDCKDDINGFDNWVFMKEGPIRKCSDEFYRCEEHKVLYEKAMNKRKKGV